MGRVFYVSSSLNRASIQAYGLDWKCMAAAPGIAGSVDPEQEGCFLCLDIHETEWFVQMNNTGGPVDIWAVDDVDVNDLIESPEGYFYLPNLVAAERLTLWRQDC